MNEVEFYPYQWDAINRMHNGCIQVPHTLVLNVLPKEGDV